MTDDLDGLVERLQAPIRIVGTTSEDACEIYDDLRLDAAAAIMRLRGENERLIRINKDHCSAVNTYILSCIKLENKLAAAEAELAKAREALRPFAECQPYDVMEDHEEMFGGITAGDLRRARAIVEKPDA